MYSMGSSHFHINEKKNFNDVLSYFFIYRPINNSKPLDTLKWLSITCFHCASIVCTINTL